MEIEHKHVFHLAQHTTFIQELVESKHNILLKTWWKLLFVAIYDKSKYFDDGNVGENYLETFKVNLITKIQLGFQTQ